MILIFLCALAKAIIIIMLIFYFPSTLTERNISARKVGALFIDLFLHCFIASCTHRYLLYLKLKIHINHLRHPSSYSLCLGHDNLSFLFSLLFLSLLLLFRLQFTDHDTLQTCLALHCLQPTCTSRPAPFTRDHTSETNN